MSEISFSMSKNNFKLLVKHVFIGHWVLTADHVERNKEYDDFFSFILSVAKNYNIMDEIEYDEKIDDYFFTADKEEELMEEIYEYEEESFWVELVDRLAERDAIDKIGEKKFEKLDKMERMKAICNEEEKYQDEFEKNGINRIYIKK